MLNERIYEVFAGVDLIVHAGDIGNPTIVWELEYIAPTIAILGNNDWDIYGDGIDRTAHKTIEGVKTFITHFPREADEAAASGEYGLVIHGHTHVPRDEIVQGCRVINPGSATRPRGGSQACVAIVEIEDGKIGPVQTIVL